MSSNIVTSWLQKIRSRGQRLICRGSEMIICKSSGKTRRIWQARIKQVLLTSFLINLCMQRSLSNLHMLMLCLVLWDHSLALLEKVIKPIDVQSMLLTHSWVTHISSICVSISNAVLLQIINPLTSWPQTLSNTTLFPSLFAIHLLLLSFKTSLSI